MGNTEKLERHANPVLKDEVCACPPDQEPLPNVNIPSFRISDSILFSSAVVNRLDVLTYKNGSPFKSARIKICSHRKKAESSAEQDRR